MWSLGFVCLSSFWFAPNASIATDSPWKSHRRFCTWVCVCKHVLGVVSAFSLPSSSVPSQNCEDQTAVAVSWQCVCAGLCPALVSLNKPSFMSWTTLCHLLSPASSNISTGRDVFFRRPDMLGEKAWTLGLSTSGDLPPRVEGKALKLRGVWETSCFFFVQAPHSKFTAN